MIKEERAEKWFLGITNSENMDLDEKIKVCDYISKIMLLVFIGSLIIEVLLAYILTGGEIFNFLSGLINGVAQNEKVKFTAVFGVILLVPFIVVPFALMAFIKKRLLISSCSNK